MIVRERIDAFIMIEQHHHAALSSILYDNISPTFALQKEAVHYAIRDAVYYHDVGWVPFDASPLWDDLREAPHSFITMPHTIKTVLYKHGIDLVQEINTYAALLCSEHYIRFLQSNTSESCKQFIQTERSRQANIIATYDIFDHDKFGAYYELLQFFDNLSLYICLHELGDDNEDTHYFFKNGIPIPGMYGGDKLQLCRGDCSITLDKALFNSPMTLSLSEKNVSKSEIEKKGLIKAWEHACEETVDIIIR